MTSALACALLLWQAPIQQPPRLRTLLPNGAVVLVERVPKAATLSVQLLASARGTEESPKTHGLRHLLEHLMARGRAGDLDLRLESEGAFLRPSTLRDAMIYEVELPPGKLELGLRAVQELLRPPKIAASDIQREARVLRQEQALRDSFSRFSEAGWASVYGPDGLDPQGNLEVMAGASPEALLALHRTTFQAPNVALVIAGEVDLDAATEAARRLLEPLPKASPTPWRSRTAVAEPRSAIVDAQGDALALPVGPYRHPSSAAGLAAALALASDLPDGFVTYTPSSRPGLVLVGTRNPVDMRRRAASASAEELFGIGKDLARRWVERQLRTPREAATWRGLLLVQEPDLRPETMLENVAAMTFEQFASALTRLATQAAPLPGVPIAHPLRPSSKSIVLQDAGAPAAGSTVIETFSRDEKVSLEAIVALPALSGPEMKALDACLGSLTQGTYEFARSGIRAVAGDSVQVYRMPDHVRVGFQVDPADLSLGLSLMENLLFRANLRQDALTSAPWPARNYWTAALWPEMLPEANSPSNAAAIYQRVFRPERVTLSVSGPVRPGEATRVWRTRLAALRLPRATEANPYASGLVLRENNGFGITTIELRSPVDPRSPQFPASTLALFALGSGKGSTLFRVVRDQMGLSYRQEAILWPGNATWQARILLAALPEEGEVGKVEKLREAIRRDVERWTEADRTRALAMAEAVLMRGNEFGPFYFAPDRALDWQENAAYLGGYWHWKTGEFGHAMGLLTAMRAVDLKSLQAAAAKMASGEAVVLSGR